MRPFTSTLPFPDALRQVIDAAVPVARTERVALGAADGRVAASRLTATIDVPPFDRSAMDGYAVRAADTAGATMSAPVTLRCTSRIYTGDTAGLTLNNGECMEIATGAPLPPGADAVVMVEETAPEGTRVAIRAEAKARQHVSARAADMHAGQTVLEPGQVLNPSRIGAAAATGAEALDVYARPTVAIISTGNELTPPGRPLPPGHVYEINRFTLDAVLRRHGAVPEMRPSVGDTIDGLVAALDLVRQADIIVVSGGSSVGERDLLLDAVRARGEVIFHGVAVKPGKPLMFARVGATTLFGLPGNPASCLSNAYLFVVPFLRRLAHLPDWEPRRVALPLARRIASAAARHQFYTVRIADGQVEPAFKASGDITSMANADGYIEIAAGTEVIEPGTVVTVTLF